MASSCIKDGRTDLIYYEGLYYDLEVELLPEKAMNRPETMTVESLIKYVKYLQKRILLNGSEIENILLKQENQKLKDFTEMIQRAFNKSQFKGE